MKKFLPVTVAIPLLVLFHCLPVYSEGTRQFMPTSSSKGQLCINKYRNDFAFYNGKAEFRLNITVADTAERIRYGFGKIVSTNTSGFVYRIKDPSGNIVLPESPVPTAGKGFINSYSEAVAGPLPAAGGYDYNEFQPSSTGDYYMEFYYPGTYTDDNRRYLEFFDITVFDGTKNPVDGRVWSKAWQFWSGSDSYSTNDKFYGKLMVLSDDSIVTQVDCNGFRGGSFSFSSNMTGCSQTGNIEYDRKSRASFFTYPQYKVFLNDPDNALFPTQKVSSGIIDPVTITTDCNNGSADFGIKVDKDCMIKLFIQVNPSPGEDLEDVQLIFAAKANPGGNGYNFIHWDGKDNLGKQVANNTSLVFTVTNLSGLTHLPIYDIENNQYGFIVNQIRPAGGQLKIYWDDTSIGGSSNTSTGCISLTGCHTWNNDFGNNNTINSWWFVSGSETRTATFITKREPGNVSLAGNTLHCIGEETLLFSIIPEPNSTSYNLSYTGSGVIIEKSNLDAKLTFSSASTPGSLIIQGVNGECGVGPETSVPIIFEPLPVVTLASFPETCYTAPGFKLTGGQPAGGTYGINGTDADSLFPYKEPEGIYQITYYYTSPTGCSNADTSSIRLYNAPECEGTVFFPDAFSPNGDNLNDSFRPVIENVYSFKMNIFNRWGQVIYSAEIIGDGWDGKIKGRDCPVGLYSYEATYAPSLRTDEYKTKRGMFTLMR